MRFRLYSEYLRANVQDLVWWGFCYCLLLETGFHDLAQTGLKLKILLQSPECWASLCHPRSDYSLVGRSEESDCGKSSHCPSSQSSSVMKSASQPKPSASGFRTHHVCEKQPFPGEGHVPREARGSAEDARPALIPVGGCRVDSIWGSCCTTTYVV